MFKVITTDRPLNTYGEDINIFAKGLPYPTKLADLLNKLPKTKKPKLYLVKEEK